MRQTFQLICASGMAAVFATSAVAQSGSVKAVPLSPSDSPSELEILRSQLRPGDGPDGPGYDLNWYTMDGGGATYLTGGAYELGATAGQPDAGFMSGGAYELGGGFWYGVQGNSCYANCDNSTIAPILNSLDFTCFLNAFAANLPYANCDNSTIPPVLNALDFTCFLNAFAAGCT